MTIQYYNSKYKNLKELKELNDIGSIPVFNGEGLLGYFSNFRYFKVDDGICRLEADADFEDTRYYYDYVQHANYFQKAIKFWFGAYNDSQTMIIDFITNYSNISEELGIYKLEHYNNKNINLNYKIISIEEFDRIFTSRLRKYKLKNLIAEL